jgi:hypothetical protein
MAITYLRVKESFEVSSDKFPSQRNDDVSTQITAFLDTYGATDWDLVHYEERFRSESIFDVTAVFKK